MPPKVAPPPRNRRNFKLMACFSSSFARCERIGEAMLNVSNGKAIRRKRQTSCLASARDTRNPPSASLLRKSTLSLCIHMLSASTTVSPSIANPRAPSRTFQLTLPSFVGSHALPEQGAAELTTNPSLSYRHDETCNFAQTATMTHKMAFRGNLCVKVNNVMVVAVGPCGIKSLLRLSRRQPPTPLTTFS